MNIVSYDKQWPDLYSRERDRLIRIFSDASPVVEHIGATAVPGLSGRPVIDILMGVIDRRQLQTGLPGLTQAGYQPEPPPPAALSGCTLFVKPSSSGTGFRLYVVEIGGEHWRHLLLVRDYLRAHQGLIDEFSRLKHSLVDRASDRPEAYDEEKIRFIRKLQKEAEDGFCPFC